MNERIRELVEQVGGISHDDDGNQLPVMLGGTSAVEKFAELIVGECAEVANQYYKGAKHGPGFMICEEIKQHFGVEENAETSQSEPKRDLMKGLWKV